MCTTWMVYLNQSVSVSSCQLRRWPITVHAPHFLQKLCIAALLRDIALHIPPELIQSNIRVHVFMPLLSNGNSINRIGCKGIFGMTSWFSLQSPLFLAIDTDLDMSSIQPHLQQSKRVWTQTWAVLLWTAAHNHHYANHHWTLVPSYEPGQKVWLAAKDIPLKAMAWKLAPRFTGTYEVESSALQLLDLSCHHLCESTLLFMFPRLSLTAPIQWLDYLPLFFMDTHSATLSRPWFPQSDK